MNVADRFQRNILDLIDFISDIIQDANDSGYDKITTKTCNFARDYIKVKNIEDIMENLIEKLHPYWDNIKNKELEFLKNKASVIFSDITPDSLNILDDLLSWTNEKEELIVSEDDIESFWSFFHSFVVMFINYIHEERDPEYDPQGRFISYQNADYFEEIELERYAKIWDVKLKQPVL
jgi:hypothetical protein